MKLLLIATTALVCVTSLAAAGNLPERRAGSGQSDLDTNGEFLCNHGFDVHTFVHNSSGYYSTKWERAATPIIGTGKPVNEITIDEGRAYSMQIAIYSSRRDEPQYQLVETDYHSHPGCSRVSVPIPAITLKKGKKYWVVERHWLLPRTKRIHSSGYTTASGLTEL